MEGLCRAAVDAITNPNAKDFRDIPGPYGCRLLNGFDIMMNGHGYFYKKIEKNKCSVVRTNVIKHMTALCDREAIQTMYDPDKILKEPSFIKLKLNPNVLGGSIPCMFSNGERHEKAKTFAIELIKISQGNVIVECVNRIVVEYFRKWQKTVPGKNFEDELRYLTRDVHSLALFGGKLNPERMEIWKKGLFSEIGSNNEKRSNSVLPNILDELKALSRMEYIRKISEESGLSVEEALHQCLFIIGFNIEGSSVTLTSCIAELHLLDNDMKACLKMEVTSNIKETGLTYEALSNMTLLESFVKEACRLHPAVSLIFGKTSKDFVLQSNLAEHVVKKDEVLLGEVYICQRDSNIFKDPDTFKADRFCFEDGLLNDLLVFGGCYHKDATPTDHKCPGQNVAIEYLKAVLVYFISSCQFTLAGNMSWVDKKLQRFSCPDAPLRLKSFILDSSSPISAQLTESEMR